MSKVVSNVKIVKVEGCFTEWYSPFFKDPYDDDPEYAEFYDKRVLDMYPVIGPDVNGKGEFLSGDLEFLADRLTCGAKDWDKARKGVMKAVKLAIKSGKPQVFRSPKVTPVRITPYRRVPKIPDKSYRVYGKYAGLIKERVARVKESL